MSHLSLQLVNFWEKSDARVTRIYIFLALHRKCHILPRKRHFLGPAGTKLNFNFFEQSQPNILTIRLGLKGWDPSTVTHPNLRPQARKTIWLGLTLIKIEYIATTTIAHCIQYVPTVHQYAHTFSTCNSSRKHACSLLAIPSWLPRLSAGSCSYASPLSGITALLNLLLSPSVPL